MTFYRFAVWIVRPILWPFWQWRGIGKENIPKRAKGVIASNHIKWWDPLLIALCAHEQEIHFLAKKELFKNPLLKWVIEKLHGISVDRHKADLNSLKSCIKAVKDGDMLGIFPEGTRNKSDELLPFEEGAAFIALKCGEPIYPVYIQRGRTGIKKHIYFGEPVDVSAAAPDKPRSERMTEITERLRNAVLMLEKQHTSAVSEAKRA